MTKNKVVICLTTHKRVDCARINMEIIKYNYPTQWPIVHACSKRNYKKYIEDILVKCSPMRLTMGAFNLLRESIAAAETNFPTAKYIVHIEGDTWLMNQAIIEKYIALLDKSPSAIIATSSWSTDKSVKWKNSHNPFKNFLYYLSKITSPMSLNFQIGGKRTISTQFFIVKNTPAFKAFIKHLPSVSESDVLEEYFYNALRNEFGRKSFIWMNEREPVHPNHRIYCEKLELFCQHYPTANLANEKIFFPVKNIGKKEVLERYPRLRKGPHMNKLINSKNLKYYNFGAKRI